MKRILVSGGAGFIGSHLCRALIADGYFVYCVDNFSSGRRVSIQDLLIQPHFECITHDIIDPLSLEVDAIYNCACPASPVQYQEQPIQTLKSSVLGSLQLLELAKRLQCPILQCSTSEVYGDPSEHPQKESYWGNVNPIGPRSCYDEGKRCAETLCFDFHRQHKVAIKVARIFNTYGPSMCINDGRVISNFIVSALQGKPIHIHGNGSQTRSFCYISDMINALRLFMDSPNTLTGPINLGNPEEISIKALATLILSLTESSSSINYSSLPDDDPKQRKPDIRLASEQLSWTPTISLEKGLKSSIQYFKTQLNV